MTKKCQSCGKAFEASRNDAKYCSDTCKTKHYQQRQKKKAEVEKVQARQDQRDQNIKNQVVKIEQENASIKSQITWSENEISRLENENRKLVFEIKAQEKSRSQIDRIIRADDGHICRNFLDKKPYYDISLSRSLPDPYFLYKKEIDDFKRGKTKRT